VWSELLALHQENSRRERIARAEQHLEDLREKLRGKRPRLKSVFNVELRDEEILKRSHVEKYVCVHVFEQAEAKFRQEHRGRPGPDTRYRKLVRRRIDLLWEVDEAAIAYNRKSAGMYPLLTNDRAMTPAQVLEAHKRQPVVEKRFEQPKTVYEIAPVFLKNEDRVEALFFLYFFALLVQALIERELRTAMAAAKIASLPLYPKGRECKRPTADQIFRLFSLLERITILADDEVVQVVHPELTPLQSEVLELLWHSRTDLQTPLMTPPSLEETFRNTQARTAESKSCIPAGWRFAASGRSPRSSICSTRRSSCLPPPAEEAVEHPAEARPARGRLRSPSRAALSGSCA
jgi:hypothetical protein